MRPQPIVIVEAPPRLDATASPIFGSFVIGLVEAGAHRLILDFSAVGYLGSSGIRSLMLISKSLAAHNGRLALLGCHPTVTEVLRICGLNEDLKQAEVIEDARQCV